MALGLGSTESLGQHHTGSMFVSSLIHYPTVSLRQVRSGEVIRNPAHSDFGTLTLLFQRDVGGLQVADMSSTDKTNSTAVNESAKFLDVELNPETILVNVGYLLMRWTNGRWKNTVHRVSEPPSANGRKVREGDELEMVPERYSIAFFSFPDAKTNVGPLGSLVFLKFELLPAPRSTDPPGFRLNHRCNIPKPSRKCWYPIVTYSFAQYPLSVIK
jgi:isopenicillin N synthase-like dioxygenase